MHRSINQIVESIGRLARERGEIIDKLAGRGGTRTKNVHHFVKIPNPSGTRHYEWGSKQAYAEYTGRNPNGDDGFWTAEADQYLKDRGFELTQH